VTDFPGEHPDPPGDLEISEPLITQLPMGAILCRLHARGKNPLFFGRTGGNRFDSPDRSYGVLYAGRDEYCSFIETFGQTTGIRTVTATALEGLHLAHLELLRPMKLIDALVR
jgi:RES domain